MKTFKSLTLPLRLFFSIVLAYVASWFRPVHFVKLDPRAAGVDVPNHYVNKYDDDLKLAVQQTKSRLEDRVTADYGVVGASKSFDVLGTSESQPVTGRNQDRQSNNTPTNRRWIDMADYDWDDYIDGFDKLKILLDPTNKYVTLATSAHNRAKDRVIITAMFGSARETTVAGTAVTSTLTALPAAQKIVNAATNISMAKLRSAIEILNAAEAGSPEEGGERTFVFTSNQLTKLMADSTLTSSDYNTLQALQDYKVDQFMGMKWVRSESLPKTGNIRSCGIFVMDCMGLGVGQNVTNDVSIDKTKRGFPIKVYSMMSLGAVRGQDKGVVQIDCDETA